MRSDSDTDSGTLPPPSTNEKKVLPPSSGSYSASTTTEKEWTKHEDATDQETQINDEVLQLARRYTTQSNAALSSLFPVPAKGPLNPSSPDFNTRKWAKSFYNIRTDTSERNPPKTTGIAFKNLNIFRYSTSTDYQKSVSNIFLKAASSVKKLTGTKEQRINILHDLEGVVHSGEILAVLGPPGSGCSTLLKTIARDTHGFYISDDATINYQGIQPKDIRTAFRSEAIYTAKVNEHFAHLTVKDTLYFTARARYPKNIPEGITRREYAKHLRNITIAIFSISHTKNTQVKDDFDNSTRGLDSTNALGFYHTLRTQADTIGCTSCVAIYQASQDTYDVFNKVIVLFEGRQIYFSKTTEARAYFEGLGFIYPEQQTTADFLTSMTSHQERYAHLLEDIKDYLQRHPFSSKHYDKFPASRRINQSKSQRQSSPFTLSYMEQMRLTLWRSGVMLKSNPSITLTMLITNIFKALIISSLFYNLSSTTSSFFRRSILLFFTVIINAFGSILEIMTLYAKHKIVKKHAQYALYHPSAEALSAMIIVT
ncbi:ABC-2 type transporter [Colletotrichum cuscutae]|uniref:ABC-2 type transporter n=1 Tax=Colletotrichum cuscutae TaxID=1209917 RepID=A0AAI9U8W1_9PEZI|nr:ABC-2 type transporter [Colletotrichum cuscutae]